MTPGRWKGASPKRLLTGLAGGYFLCTVVGIALTPVMPFDRFDWPVAAITALLCGGFAVHRTRRRVARQTSPTFRPEGITRRESIVTTAVCLVLVVVSTFAAWTILYRYSWDAGVIRQATQTPDTPHGLVTHYFALYPNNLPFLGLARLVSGAGHALGISYASSFLGVNALLLFISLVGTWAGIRAFGSRRSGWAGIALVWAFVGLSPWMLVGYTDMPAMALATAAVAATLWAFAIGPAPAQIGLLLAAGVGIGGALTFKPMPAVLIVAFVVACCLYRGDVTRGMTTGHQVARLAAVPAAAAVSYLALALPLSAASHTSPADLATVPKQTQLTWVASGSHYEKVNGVEYYGGYDGPLVDATTRLRPAEQNRVALENLSRDFDRRGLPQTVAFYWHKNVWNWGDGMFWAYGEGRDARRPVLHNRALTAAIASWNRPGGKLWHLRSGVTTGVWIAVLALTGLGLLRARSAHLLYLALCLLGVAAFDEIFQARSRYVFAFVPFVVITAMLVLPLATTFGRERRSPTA